MLLAGDFEFGRLRDLSETGDFEFGRTRDLSETGDFEFGRVLDLSETAGELEREPARPRFRSVMIGELI